MLLGRAQIWRTHTESYKFLLDILANNSSAENRTDLRLGQVAYLSIFYNIRGLRYSMVAILVFDGATVKTTN